MKFSVMMVVPLFLLMSSCSHVPKESSHFLTYQDKLQASDHWESVANNISNKVKDRLKYESEVDRLTSKLGMNSGQGHITPEPVNNTKTKIYGPICVAENDKSEFGSSIQTFLKDKLYHNGIQWSCSESTPYYLEWEVSKKEFNSERANYSPGLVQVVLEAPVYLLFGGRDVDIRKPHTEILITFLLKNKFSDTVMLRDSSIFYINDEDSAQYWLTSSSPDDKGTTHSRKFIATNKK